MSAWNTLLDRLWRQGLELLIYRWRIGLRLAAMMALAAGVAVALTASGIRGLADSAESLHGVYEQRMKPVRTLSQIAHLMLANQHQLQIALARAPSEAHAVSGHPLHLDPTAAHDAASAIERNIQTIDALWIAYQSKGAMSDAEQALVHRFSAQRASYLQEAVIPALAALRSLNQEETLKWATTARTFYDQASLEIQALIELQFDSARAADETGMQRYRTTRTNALLALPAAMLVLGLLGIWQIRSIVLPLRKVTEVFHHIAAGQLDSPITVPGRDEVSVLLRELQTLQVRLANNEKAIHRLAFYDVLTNLPNRRLLRERIQDALEASRKDPNHRAVRLLDLDHFKTINDTLGHEVGDQFLREVTRRLQHHALPRHFVARIGGDEFVVLTGALGTDEDGALLQARAVAQQLLTALAEPCALAGRLHHASTSIGLCLFHDGNASIKELLKRADLAMYQAKNTGRNRVCTFDPAMLCELEDRTALAAALHRAIEGQQLSLRFQPQVDPTGRPLGAEVLLRWHHPERGAMAPKQFIPIAESSGLILPIGAWVLHQSCLQLKAWSCHPATQRLDLSVNVSERQFRQPGFVSQVLQILAETRADPQRLVLELTESLAIDDVDDTATKMQALHAQGIRFALDDFGTGYSSLSLLRRLPLHMLKIDGSFVRDISTAPEGAAMVRTILGMARSLGLLAIAEGVETHAQQHALRLQRCQAFQGYLYTPPLPIESFEAWLRTAPSTHPTEPPSPSELP